MRRSFNMGRSFMLFVIILPIMTILSILLYTEYVQTKDNVFNILQKHLLDEKSTLFKNYSNFLTQRLGANLASTIHKDKLAYRHYEQELYLLQGNDIKYLYLLYKDKSGKFRFLLDATKNAQEKASFKQKFDPQTDIWEKAYKSKKPQITKQDNLDTLWMTIAYPLIVDNKVVAVLGADFTYDVYDKIVNTLKPMEKIHYYVSVFMVIMLVVAYILIYLYYINRKKSFIDPLTQVYNRQYLYEFLKTSSLQHYQLMMIDLDHFKQINDTYGHDVGDMVLISVVKEIKANIRKNDLLIRFGGEEFLVLTYKQDLEGCVSVASRIKNAIMIHKMKFSQREILMTISIGINPFPFHSKNFDEAIKIADEQLYNAKISGRNCIKVSQKSTTEQTQSSKRIIDVNSAIEEDRIKCAYQPILCARTNKIVKYEMLLRLIDKNNSVTLPMDFLPSIRHTNIYVNITKIVLDNAMQTLRENNFELTINLDLQDIMNDDIVKLLSDKFKDHRKLAERLYIEILEHEEITNFRTITKHIAILKELGFKVALDDFGSGFANFKYLIHLDIDVLKIDGSLIRDVHTNKRTYHIIETISAFAKKMNIKTVAEQIETKNEFETLKALGIDYLQGYYIGKPYLKYS